MPSTGTTLPSASDVLHDHHRGGVRFQGPEDVRRVARVGYVVAGAEVGWLTGRADLRPAGAEHHVFGAAGIVWLGEPRAMNRRLIAQSGTFLVPANLHKSIEEILKEYPNPEETLIKFLVPADKVREKGMRELYRMNITQATLFPDLDGLARSLAYELEFHWAYDPRTMKRVRQ